MADSTPQEDLWHDDPIYHNALREAKFITFLWTCCFFYTVIYCYLYGYLTHESLPSSTGPAVGQVVGLLESFNRDPQSVSYPLGLGIPDWVFYGVVLPWGVCVVISVWYCLVMFVEDDLSDSAGETEESTA